MTTLTRPRATTDGTDPAGPPAPPRARRLARPSWRDLRLVVGALLVLLSVAGGTRLVASLDDTTAVYAATRDLLPGQPVTPEDVVPVDVRIEERLGAYVDASSALAPGIYLTRAVGSGELVPVAALGTASQALDKSLAIPVDAVVAGNLSTGTVVDVWVSPRDDEAVGEAYLDPRLLLAGAVVDHVNAEQGGLGPALGRTAVQVVVPAERVADVIAAVDQDARMTLVPAPRSAAPGEGR